MNPPAKRYRNKILSSLPVNEITKLSEHLLPLRLPQSKGLLDGTSKNAYFLEDGIASVVVTLEDGHTVEVGVIGVDGVVGIPGLLGAGAGPGRTFIQIQGSGFSINSKILKDHFERPGQLRNRLQKYIQGFIVQTAQTAACNRLHTIEGRLARWLLSCRDRISSDELRLTHEFLSQMLGAPRTTVTLAAGILQDAGLIKYGRGVVTIRNRPGLEKVACECYRTVRDEYRRLGLL